MELNAVAVEHNKAAFMWGRRAAHDPASVQRLLSTAKVISLPARRQSLADLVASRVAFLTDYQDAAYARRYADTVERVREAESRISPKTLLAEAVASNLFKLMAYKDEYEVARLHTDAAFAQKIAGMFEGEYKLAYHLAPPLLARRNAQGELVKQRFGPWMGAAFRLLARLKGLRGTALDVFGHTEERRGERALIADYLRSVEDIIAGLTPANHAQALELARIAEHIKGFGHVKAKNLAATRAKWQAATEAFRAASPDPLTQAA
jgi:indolepyruvate ferredoxin oxidoreductase